MKQEVCWMPSGRGQLFDLGSCQNSVAGIWINYVCAMNYSEDVCNYGISTVIEVAL